MAVSDDRKYTKAFVHTLLEGIKGKTLGEVDKSHQFARTERSDIITGIAGDVIEQSVFGYARDSKQECDIEIDGVLTELKTTGVRIPKSDLAKVKDKTENESTIKTRLSYLTKQINENEFFDDDDGFEFSKRMQDKAQSMTEDILVTKYNIL